MATYYGKRALMILRDDVVEISKSIYNFLWRQIPFRWKITYRNRLSQTKYEAPTKPLKIYWINPERIQNSVRRFSRSKKIGTIEVGEWDQERTKFVEHPIYQGLYERFEKKYEWKNTQYVKWAAEEIKTEGSKWGYSTVDSFIKNRCSYVDQLYQDIKENGYEPQSNLGNKKRDTIRHKIISNSHIKTHEVGINIGRNGEILLNTGNHRLSIAKILGLEQIPVQIIVRHEQWQAIRCKIHKNGLPEGLKNLRDHPDLQDIIY